MADGSTMAMTAPEVLEAYAARGVLRNFSADGKGEFGFLWMGHTPMRVQWKPGARTVTFRDLFPNIPARGEIDRELRTFLKERTDAGLPDHRRVDPAQFEIVCQNRGGQMSVGLKLTGGSEEEAMNKLMLVVHETFLMMHDRWLDYMHEEFGASLE